MHRRAFVSLPVFFGVAGCAQQPSAPTAAAVDYTQSDLERNVKEFMRGDVKQARSSQFSQIIKRVQFAVQLVGQNILISDVKLDLDPVSVTDTQPEHVRAQARQIAAKSDFALYFRFSSADEKTEFALGGFDKVNQASMSVVGTTWKYDLQQRKIILPLKTPLQESLLVGDPNYLRVWTYLYAEGISGLGGAGNAPSLFNHYLRPSA